MLSLYDLQRNFTAALKLKNEFVLNYVCNKKMKADRCFAIYQNSVLGAKQKVLKEIYPVCQKLVGEEFFIALINRYIEQSISVSPDIGEYGNDFFHFVAEFEPAKSVPYLVDVAKLELASHRLHAAPTSKTFDFNKLAEYHVEQGDNIIFQLAQSSTLISSAYPIHRIFEICQDDYKGDFNIQLAENAFYKFFIYKNTAGLRIELLEPSEWQILNWIKEGICFGDICNSFSKLFPLTRMEEILPKMVVSGWVTGFSLED